ncbi:unnamed protein product, partial [Rotaria sp. Silwood2]
IEGWIEEARQKVSDDNTSIILIGNKADLVSQRKVTHEQVMNLAKRFNVLYAETSAKDGSNVEQTIVTFAQSIYQKMSKTTDSSS